MTLILQQGHLLIPFRQYLDNVRRNAGPFTSPDFDISDEAASSFEQMTILRVPSILEALDVANDCVE
jgi:hypothetical protein